MNLSSKDLAHGILKERSKIGSSLADIDPMTVDTSVNNRRHVALYIYHRFQSPFSDRVELPLLNIISPGVLMNTIGEELLLPDALPGITHMRGMQ